MVLFGYFCPTPQKGKIQSLMRTNRAMMAGFASSSADTKLGRFDSLSFSESPFPGGHYLVFRPLSETLYPIAAQGRGRAFVPERGYFRAHVTAPIRILAEHDARKMEVLYSGFAKGVAEAEAPIIDYRPKG
jgi:hypothetical protein